MRELEMDDAVVDRLGALAAHAVEGALTSGPGREQAVIAFAIAGKAIAMKAASQNSGTPEQCETMQGARAFA